MIYAIPAGALALAMAWIALELNGCITYRGGLMFFRFGRFGGSVYLAKGRAPQ